MNKGIYRDINGTLLTVPQAATKSNFGRSTVMRLAREAGAVVRVGNSVRVNWERYYNYIMKTYSQTEE